MTANNDGMSFYFFDFDDNVMGLTTPILLLNTATGQAEPVSTAEFATIHPQLGKPGRWENHAMFEGSYSQFRDIPAAQLQPGQDQHFVADIMQALQARGREWQAPSWPLFVYACAEQRPVSMITARGHSRETLRAGIRVLRDQGLIPKEPNYLAIYPVGNDEVRRELGDLDLTKTTPALKRIAILRSVQEALRRYGPEPKHRFGMSDDDPSNISLITRAMCECKKQFPDKRFFVINTHLEEKVKLEVFPVAFPVTRSPAQEFPEPLAE